MMFRSNSVEGQASCSNERYLFINMQKMICKGFNQICPFFIPDRKLISHDGAHLTKYGARYVENILFKNKPLDKLNSI